MGKRGRVKAWVDIKQLREGYGWTQRETAMKLGISRSYLSILETRRQAISTNVMRALIHVFGVNQDDLFTEPPNATEFGGELPYRDMNMHEKGSGRT